jgi:hypothetical protein
MTLVYLAQFLYNTLMRILKLTAWIMVLTVVIFLPMSTVMAQTPVPDEHFFSQTGHYVRGEFYKQYYSTPDSLIIFGYPITDAFLDQVNGHTVQYFQRARFDSIRTDQGQQRVEIAKLGKILLASDGIPHPEMSSSGKCRRFEQTGKSVCHAFLDFYLAHKGEVYFGSPITEFVDEHDTIVQYFENVRLEWHPELPYGEKVVISDLGRAYFDLHVGDPGLIDPGPTNNLIGVSKKIELQGSVSDSLISDGEIETIYAVVQDQFHQPLVNVNVNIEIDRPDGKKIFFNNLETNQDGIVLLDYPVKSNGFLSLTQIIITAKYLNMQDSTRTWFRVW